MKIKQKVLSSRDLMRASQLFGLGIVTSSLISGGMPQQLLATEVSLDNLIETGNLEKNPQSENSSEVIVDMSGSSNPEFKLSKSSRRIKSLDKSSAAVDPAIPQSLGLELSKSVTPSIDSKNADSSTSQESNISYKAADLQPERGVNSVEALMEEQLLAREVDLLTRQLKSLQIEEQN